MRTWGEFEAAAPELAAAGRRLIHIRGDGEAFLATVRDGQEPRIHPINVGIIGEHLYAFIIARSPKRVDLEADGRYALHTLCVSRVGRDGTYVKCQLSRVDDGSKLAGRRHAAGHRRDSDRGVVKPSSAPTALRRTDCRQRARGYLEWTKTGI